MTWDFNPTNRPKEISDEIAETIYKIATKPVEELTKADRNAIILASGFILGQALLLRTIGEQDGKTR